MRFGAPYIGSSAIAGTFDDRLLARRDAAGLRSGGGSRQGRTRRHGNPVARAGAARSVGLSRSAYRARPETVTAADADIAAHVFLDVLNNFGP
jgi:hypothetical protein